ncbi:MAG: cytochrome c3 family protein [Bryobacterales bacterium]
MPGLPQGCREEARGGFARYEGLLRLPPDEIAADSPDIQKMAMLFNGGVRLDWVRVYQTPDFVFFSHKNHVKAGLSCEQCHGPVATREVLAQEVSTNMTACMNCHKERGATTECFFCHELGQ